MKNDIYLKKINSLIEDIKKSLKIKLPQGLLRLKMSRLAMSVVIAIISIIACICFKTFGFIVGIILSLYLVFLAYKLQYDFYKERIYSLDALCYNAIMTKKGVETVFMDDNNNTFYLLYPVKNNPFKEMIYYKVFLSKDNPNLIITFENK